MDIVITRTRIAGTLLFYEYRALVPLDSLDVERRSLVRSIPLPRPAGSGRCVHIAQLIAPDFWFRLDMRARADLGRRITRVARRVEVMLVRACFPEVTSDLVQVVYRNAADPGDACWWIAIDDLTGAFERLQTLMPVLSAADLGLHDPARLAA
ncbi:hypothetical protein SAMN06295912_11281 [Sphingomonas laterariae]|uniref:Uncharacterized protein n=1 Tax=Edaphosphingomonas laterariae TaxID=861865 RepID=A0A239GIU4_9SPHN|nr:hypothetical protein [Sphingomonas laterariae]SNS68698.1 hypothetical protein SAMN06295912_11281 [Sphingomonas laterariae]